VTIYGNGTEEEECVSACVCACVRACKLLQHNSFKWDDTCFNEVGSNFLL